MRNQIRKLKEKFQGQKIHAVIMEAFVMIVLLFSVFSFAISFKFTERSVIANSEDYTNQLVKKVNDDMDSYLEYMTGISSMMFNNRDIQDYLFRDDLQPELQKASYERVIDQFTTIMNTRKDIRNIAVLGDNGKSLINKGTSALNPYVSLPEELWYREAKKKDGKIVLSSSHIQNMIYNSYNWVITLSRGVVNRQSGNVEGVFLIDLNYETIDGLCRKVSLGRKGYIYVLDESGEVIYHPQQQLLYSGLKSEEIAGVLAYGGKDASFVSGTGKEKKVYTFSTSKETGWTVVGVAYLSELLGDEKKIQVTYLLLAAAFLTAGIILAIVLSRAITGPIVALDAGMKAVEKGNFETACVEVGGQEEIRRLGESFGIMVQEIQNLMEENVKEQRQKRKAEMQALQSQINPHFLYNTLDSIIWMAESGMHNEAVVEMTSALSRLFRQSIGNEDEMVPIRQEVAYTETYLIIQRMRYRDKLSFDIEIEEEVMENKIVKLTLQPLVENAIYHGIKYVERPGKIEIRGWRRGDDIILEISDNGGGMDEKTLERIFEKKEYIPDAGGLGVYNVQKRLRLYYGSQYGLSYRSIMGVGTTVFVRIPAGKE